MGEGLKAQWWFVRWDIWCVAPSADFFPNGFELLADVDLPFFVFQRADEWQQLG
ncbi:hypothetical protein D3C76_1743820 [compost metagenome]